MGLINAQLAALSTVVYWGCQVPLDNGDWKQDFIIWPLFHTGFSPIFKLPHGALVSE